MPNPLLLDIVLYLTDAGVIKGDGIDTFRDFIPEMPDNIVAITEYQGSPVVPYETTVHRSVQVSVRNKNADVARRKSFELYEALKPTSEDCRVDFTPTRWGQVSIRQTPFRLKTDANDRVTYGFNLGITTTID